MLSAILLGLINVAIYVAILLLIGVVILWVCNLLGLIVPSQATKIYIIIVALIALYMIVSLLLGLPVPGPIRL